MHCGTCRTGRCRSCLGLGMILTQEAEMPLERQRSCCPMSMVPRNCSDESRCCIGEVPTTYLRAPTLREGVLNQDKAAKEEKQDSNSERSKA
jgi:hypothetical protein